MIAPRKALSLALLAAAAAAGLYVAWRLSLLSEEVQFGRQGQARLAERLQQMQREHDALTNRLAALQEENTRLNAGAPKEELGRLRDEAARWQKAATPPGAAAANSLVEKVLLLKERLEQTPGASIPELQYLTDEDWLVASLGKLRTDEDYRRALAGLRTAGKQKFGQLVQAALNRYARANQGDFPTALSQLQPFFEAPVDDVLLQDWRIVSMDDYALVGGIDSKWAVTQKAVADEEYDVTMLIGPEHWIVNPSKVVSAGQTLAPVLRAFAPGGDDMQNLMSNGRMDVSRLKPYIRSPEQQAALDFLSQKVNSEKE